MTSSIEDLKNQLRELNIFTMRTDIQSEVAAKLHEGGMTVIDLARLIRCAESTHKTKAAAIATVCRVLRLSIDHIKEAVRQIRDPVDKVASTNDATVAKTTSSAPRFAGSENPYGWSSPDTMRGADHGEVGTWNAFRQCYNMTSAEMRKAGAYDARRHGCSRFEVLGKGKVKPKARWDDAEGARLKHMSSLSEPIGGGSAVAEDGGEDDGAVYGEPR